MKKFIATILSVALITTVIITPTIKVNTPSFNVGTNVSGNKSSTIGTTIQ